MNIMFYILIMIGAVIAYFFLSFIFEVIGKIAIKLAKTFKNNIMDSKEKEKINSE